MEKCVALSRLDFEEEIERQLIYSGPLGDISRFSGGAQVACGVRPHPGWRPRCVDAKKKSPRCARRARNGLLWRGACLQSIREMEDLSQIAQSLRVRPAISLTRPRRVWADAALGHQGGSEWCNSTLVQCLDKEAIKLCSRFIYPISPKLRYSYYITIFVGQLTHLLYSKSDCATLCAR